jgi:hypothetical protein
MMALSKNFWSDSKSAFRKIAEEAFDKTYDGEKWDKLFAKEIVMWQPIETAPKDGTDIIVMYVHISTQIVHAAFWLEYQEGLDNPDDEGWWTYDWSEVSRVKMSGDWTPTHWMPLPALPEGAL